MLKYPPSNCNEFTCRLRCIVTSCAAPHLGWPHGEVEGKNMGELVQRMDFIDGEREREKEKESDQEGSDVPQIILLPWARCLSI